MMMLVGLFCLLAVPAPADDLACSACGSEISGDYLTLEGKPYCSEACIDTVLPTCAACARTIRGSHLILEGRHYCNRSCLSLVLPACATCGGPVEGNYFESRGKLFCSESCYRQSLPRCEACGDPMSAWIELEGHLYCHPCADADRCDACNHPGPASTLQDGRRICDICWETAVMDQEDGEQLFRLVRRRMKRDLGLSTDHDIDFRLVGRDELEQLTNGRASGHELGYYQYQAETTTTYFTTRDRHGREEKRVAGERTEEIFRIFILYGLPEKRLMEVAAHELAHDWMRENLPRIKAPIFEEGFAEYVAWLMNRSFGHRDLMRRIEENTDPVYGDGFKMMRQLAERHGGLEGLIDYLADQR
jgi:hypothetical protein